MLQTIFCAWAVAVTERPGTAAVRVTGPHVLGLTLFQSQIGSPTRPEPLVSGAIPMSGPSRDISAMARCASSWYDGRIPAGGSGDQVGS